MICIHFIHDVFLLSLWKGQIAPLLRENPKTTRTLSLAVVCGWVGGGKGGNDWPAERAVARSCSVRVQEAYIVAHVAHGRHHMFHGHVEVVMCDEALLVAQ